MNYAFLASYPGAVGIKTGFTDRAGSCIMAAARRNGRTMLAVVMNGYNPTQSAIDLLNEGFGTPVAAEGTTDRLPPPSLPDPAPALGTGPLRRSSGRHPVPAGTNTGPATTLGHPGGRRGPTSAPASRAEALGGGATPPPSPHGLASVLAAWPAQVLLVLAGSAALYALWELRSLQQLNVRSRRAPGTYRRGTAPMKAMAGGRRRREQLVASYRRHEHL